MGRSLIDNGLLLPVGAADTDWATSAVGPHLIADLALASVAVVGVYFAASAASLLRSESSSTGKTRRKTLTRIGIAFTGCALLHAAAAFALWWPAHHLAGAAHLIAAAMSAGTVVALARSLPKLMEAPRDSASLPEPEEADRPSAAGDASSDCAHVEAERRSLDVVLGVALNDENAGSWQWDLESGEVSCGEDDAARLQIPEVISAAEFYRRIHPEDARSFRRACWQSVREVSGGEAGFRFLMPDDSARWLSCRWQALPGPDGRATVVVGISQDISPEQDTGTDHIADLAAVAARAVEGTDSERRLANANRADAASGMGSWRWDIVNDVVEYDDAELDLLRMTSRTGPVKEFFDRVHVSDAEGLKEAIKESISTGVSLDHEFRFCYPDGSVRWLASRAQPAFDKDGCATALTGVNYDITGRKEHEAELAEAQALADAQRRRMELALEAGRMGSWVWNLASGLIDYDAFSRILLNVRPNEDHIDSFLANVAEEDVPDLKDAISAALNDLDSDDAYEVEFRVYLNDGTTRWITSRANVIRDENGEAVEVVGISYDATDIRERERELAKAQIAALDASRAKSEFLANMSHEIRTPLTAILGCSEVLYPLQQTDRQRELLSVVRSQGKLLMQILNDVLDLSKIDAGKLTIVKEPAKIRQIVSDVQTALQPLVEDAGLTLETVIPPNVPETVLIDDLRLRQIFLNLVGNAIKFTEFGGITIRVRSDWSPDFSVGGFCQIWIAIEDTGVGIPPDRVKAIFEAFQQADGSINRSVGGTGLGLTICRRLAGVMGGTLDVDTEVGHGSVFTLSLPVEVVLPRDERPAFSPTLKVATPAPDAAPDEAEDDPGPSPESESVERALPIRLLVAEDTVPLQFLIRALLEDQVHSLTVVGNGAEAIEAVEQAEAEDNLFDLILMDMQMPEVDGFEATRRLRENGFTGSIYALTAGALPEERANAIASGCNGQIDKPIDRDVLMGVLKDIASSILA